MSELTTEEREALAEALWQAEKAAPGHVTNYPDRWADEPMRDVYRRMADAVIDSPVLTARLASRDARLAAVEAACRWADDHTISDFSEGWLAVSVIRAALRANPDGCTNPNYPTDDGLAPSDEASDV